MKEKKTARGCLIALLCMIALVLGPVLGIKISEHIPKTIDTKTSSGHAVILQAVGSPDWPFGSQEGRIVLKKERRTIARVSFTLHNDGKNMGCENWRVEWRSDRVIVTVSGEEQGDKVYQIFYTGEVL